MDSSRRSFLKTAAMTAATSAVVGSDSGFGLPVIQAEDLPPGDDGIVWNKAPCRFCGTGCHVQVGVEEGRVVAVAGDKHADVNKGLLCVKGYHVGAILYGKDRLTKPLLRKGDSYVEISWDEAIDVRREADHAKPRKSLLSTVPANGRSPRALLRRSS